jgi:uncharacterized membrane protein
MDLSAWLAVLMRFLHIASVVALVGGAFYARTALTPVLNALPEAQRTVAAQTAQARFRSTLFVLLILVVFSGLYSFLTGPKHTSTWQMAFGIKMLLVLHILATAILWATSPYGDVAIDGKGKRRLASIVISGFLAILAASYLRRLTAQGL